MGSISEFYKLSLRVVHFCVKVRGPFAINYFIIISSINHGCPQAGGEVTPLDCHY